MQKSGKIQVCGIKGEAEDGWAKNLRVELVGQ
jgi:hypothetical protein